MSLAFEVLQSLAALATAIGVGLGAWQLRIAKKQALTEFEDSLSSQYREVIRDIPVQALLGEGLSPGDAALALPAFFQYFDLSNEQAFLHRKGRVTDDTWADWKEGIQQNLARPALQAAWVEISQRAFDSFDELRRLAASDDDQPKNMTLPGYTTGREGSESRMGKRL